MLLTICAHSGFDAECETTGAARVSAFLIDLAVVVSHTHEREANALHVVRLVIVASKEPFAALTSYHAKVKAT